MKITYLGHATLLVEFNDKKLLFDPFITGNLLVDVNKLTVDYTFITHDHQDHILDVEKIAHNNDKILLVSNFEIITWFQSKNLNGHSMNHGGKYVFDFGIAKYVNAVHSSSLPDGFNGGNPGGFVIYDDFQSIYTALTKDMEIIPQTCPKLDVAILPIGDNFTMGYEDAVITSQYIGCDKVIGCHYDTFPPIKIDKEKAVEHFNKNGKELVLMDIGDTKEIN